MKTLIAKSVKSRVIQTMALLAVTAVVAISIAASSGGEGRVKLGGTWVGKSGDITWTSTYNPDSSGQNATCTLQWMTLSTDFEALFAAFGADHPSIVSGCLSMTSPDTAKGKLIWYIVAEGTPSTTHPVAGQIKLVAVMTSDWHFTSPSSALGKHELKVYTVDPQNPMVPNEAYCFYAQTFENVPHIKIF